MYRFAQYVAIACETTLPDVVTQQHHIGMIGVRFVWQKAVSDDWLNAQERKKIGTGWHRGDHLRAGWGVEDVDRTRRKSNIGKISRRLLPLRNLGVGDTKVLVALS